MKTTNMNYVTRFWKEIWNDRNFTALEELISNDYSVNSLSNPEKIILGRNAIKANVEKTWTKYDDFKLELEKIFCDGDSVISVIKLSGVNRDNKEFMLMNEIVIHKIENNKIANALSIATQWVIG